MVKLAKPTQKSFFLELTELEADAIKEMIYAVKDNQHAKTNQNLIYELLSKEEYELKLESLGAISKGDADQTRERAALYDYRML